MTKTDNPRRSDASNQRDAPNATRIGSPKPLIRCPSRKPPQRRQSENRELRIGRGPVYWLKSSTTKGRIRPFSPTDHTWTHAGGQQLPCTHPISQTSNDASPPALNAPQTMPPQHTHTTAPTTKETVLLRPSSTDTSTATSTSVSNLNRTSATEITDASNDCWATLAKTADIGGLALGILSIVVTFVTLSKVNSVETSLLKIKRIPKIRKDLEEHASKLIRLTQDLPAAEIDALLVMSQIKMSAQSAMAKLSGDQKTPADILLRKIQQKEEVVSKGYFNELHVLTLELTTHLKNLEQDWKAGGKL